ncbi:MAG: NAD-dependent epimerase/dehydratase family protein [Fimbriimonadaceae bacterium]|nr:NAD-dependent epimerase/dehydratase family protein [Fimbriimonadaceae bacterium]
MPMAAAHVVFGSGPLGLAVVRALQARGEAVRQVTRGGVAPEVWSGVEVVAADLRSPAAVRDVTVGARVVYQCAQPAYHRWVVEFPPLLESILTGLRGSGARLVLGDNLYAYGDHQGRLLTEQTPPVAAGGKGRTRAALATRALAAHAAGDLEVCIGRGSDFFGPFVRDSLVGERVFEPILKGGRADILGNPDLPHSYTYIDDFGAALVTLGAAPEAAGEVFHVPCPPPLTPRQFCEQIAACAGGSVRLRPLRPTLLRLLGLFVTPLRELRELQYSFEQPYLVDSSKFTAAFGRSATPLGEAIARTTAWYQRRLAETTG